MLTDSSVSTIRETSVSLGMGMRCGFLGLLHMDVFFQRLQMEFDTPVIYTAPYVPYTLVGLIYATVLVDAHNHSLRLVPYCS